MGEGMKLGIVLPVMAVAIVMFAPARSSGQLPQQPERPRVFLDCDQCDFDYLRRTLAFVDWVRDRNDADVHVLVTTQSTGAGGDEFSLFLIGRGAFEQLQDTVRFSTIQDHTDDERRSIFTRNLALGLVPYARRTGIAPGLSVEFEPPDPEALQAPPTDPWNFWVFRARLGGSMQGESRERQASVEGSLSADRITEDMKIEVSAFGEFEEDHFELSDGEELTSTSENLNFEGLVVFSMSPHLSAGLEGSVTSSTRLNQDMAARIAPAIEYSWYPYAESSRRQITALYTVGPVRYDYADSTAFLLTSETRVEQTFEIAAGFEQPWGEIDASIEWSNFMHDFALHRIDFSSGIEVRLFRGFSLDLRGEVSRIKNQIYIPLADIPDEDILLDRRQLGTDFQYELDVGFSFTFGSVFNNVVNPRMQRGGDDFF